MQDEPAFIASNITTTNADPMVVFPCADATHPSQVLMKLTVGKNKYGNYNGLSLNSNYEHYTQS